MLANVGVETTTRLLLPDVAEALRSSPASVLELTDELHAADLAELATELEVDLAMILLATLPVEPAARLVGALEKTKRLELFGLLVEKSQARAVELAEVMAPDERADLFGELPEDVRTSLLAKLTREEQRDVRQLLAYPDGTAGSIMTTAFIAVAAEQTVRQAIEQVRVSAEEMETIYAAYAVDPNGVLVGVVSLRDLVVAKGEKTILETMEPNVISLEAEADKGEAARLIAKYDLLALPVTDRTHRLVGIITVDDVVDLIQEEAGDDVQKLGGVAPLEGAYFETGFWEFVRKRLMWLVVLFLGELLTGNAMHHYTATFENVAALIWFVPLIISSGGNAGSQSASLMIRALAVGEVKPSDFAKVLVRELSIGLSLGLALALVGALRVLLWPATRTMVFVGTVSLSIVGVVTAGTVIGSALPLLLRRLGLDPAVSSTPFIASLVDVIGLVLYFEIARAFLF